MIDFFPACIFVFLSFRDCLHTPLTKYHAGIGDQMGALFADSLRGLPLVKTINIADNNLTDVGLGPLLRAMVTIATLEVQ